jgi:RHS repeat-associated protein
VRRAFASTTSAPAFNYDPYGNPLQGTAPLTDFNYAGTFFNSDSGLYLTQYRAYDPVAGRWLSRDPMAEISGEIGLSGSQQGDSIGYEILVEGRRRIIDFMIVDVNLYVYADLNPVVQRDPNGLIAVSRPFAPSNAEFCGKKKSPTFWCEECGAPHGGLNAPYCPDCYKKSLDPSSGIAPIPKPVIPE